MKKIILFLIVILNISVSYVWANSTFYDVRGTKYEGAVERITALGIVNGVSEHTFAYNRAITRAEMAKIIVNMRKLDETKGVLGENMESSFSDVKKEDWFYSYVMIAQSLGLIKGYEDGTFKPNQEVSYAEVVALMLRYLGYSNIKQDNPNGWYWNYITKMRDLELNDYVGEVEYTKPAIRGDVVMYVWNTLITTSWGITADNDKTGFTYSHKEKTPLETFFDEYTYLDDELISGIGGTHEGIGVWVNGKFYVTNEYLPLYAKGSNITALVKGEKIYGITFDEKYTDTILVSGPEFYLKEQGYKLKNSRNSYYYGTSKDNSYVYSVINLNNNDILKTVYISPSRAVIVESINIVNNMGKDDTTEESTVTINDVKYSLEDVALYKDGYMINWSNVKKEDCLIYMENGLFAYTNTTVQDLITDFNDTNEIFIANDKYSISDNCLCYMHNQKEPVKYSELSSKKIKEYIGVEATAYLNVAEEVYKIEFGKSAEENRAFQLGVIDTVVTDWDQSNQMLMIQLGNERKTITYPISNNSFFETGDLVMVHKKEKEYQIDKVEKSSTFENDIGLEYLYDAKKIRYPMIGEYRLTNETDCYKINLKYKDNSTKEIATCKVEKMTLETIQEELEAYQLVFMYNESMEVMKLFLLNEMNKFDNQIAMVREKRQYRENGELVCSVELSIPREPVNVFRVSKEDYDTFNEKDIYLIVYESSKDKKTATIVDSFQHQSIGYKRDLVVKKVEGTSIIFETGNVMHLEEDVYLWNGHPINLNCYRFILANVQQGENQQWYFHDMKLVEKEKLKLQSGDRIAIEEMDGTIVIYRGYR